MTFVIPGVEPMPSSAGTPAAHEVVVQRELLDRAVVQAAEVGVRHARRRAPPA